MAAVDLAAARAALRPGASWAATNADIISAVGSDAIRSNSRTVLEHATRPTRARSWPTNPGQDKGHGAADDNPRFGGFEPTSASESPAIWCFQGGSIGGIRLRVPHLRRRSSALRRQRDWRSPTIVSPNSNLRRRRPSPPHPAAVYAQGRLLLEAEGAHHRARGRQPAATPAAVFGDHECVAVDVERRHAHG
jgi:hypothetical protein